MVCTYFQRSLFEKNKEGKSAVIILRVTKIALWRIQDMGLDLDHEASLLNVRQVLKFRIHLFFNEITQNQALHYSHPPTKKKKKKTL